MLPLAISAFTNGSMAASFSTLTLAPGGGPKDAGSANAGGRAKSRATNERIMRVICKNDLIALLHGDPDDGERHSVPMRRHRTTGRGCAPENLEIPGPGTLSRRPIAAPA